jgi:hypothetical protein
MVSAMTCVFIIIKRGIYASRIIDGTLHIPRQLLRIVMT